MLAPGSGRWILPPGIAAVAAVLVGLLSGAAPLGRATLLLGGLALAVLAAFLLWFFRDPERLPGEGIVSAADGRILSVEVEGPRDRVSVFMNVTDVHVNRFPLDAQVRAISEAGSGFRAAYRPDAGRNVQRHYLLDTPVGEVEVVQITGVVARRLVSFVRSGQSGHKGDRLGMIVLGSRVDVYLPRGATTIRVRAGDRVRAGVTTIAEARA